MTAPHVECSGVQQVECSAVPHVECSGVPQVECSAVPLKYTFYLIITKTKRVIYRDS